MIRDFLVETKSIVQQLTEVGLAVASNHPVIIDKSLRWSGYKANSLLIKNLPYQIKYSEIDETNNYLVKLVDGGIIQVEYDFSARNELIRHRLAFFPSTNLKKYQEAPEAYENFLHSNHEYFALTDEHVVTTPVRFDYSPADHVTVTHPSSHMTLGEFKNCRIPVSRPLFPAEFFNFVLKNFYTSIGVINDASLSFITKMNQRLVGNCIDSNESKIIHISIN